MASGTGWSSELPDGGRLRLGEEALRPGAITISNQFAGTDQGATVEVEVIGSRRQAVLPTRDVLHVLGSSWPGLAPRYETAFRPVRRTGGLTGQDRSRCRRQGGCGQLDSEPLIQESLRREKHRDSSLKPSLTLFQRHTTGPTSDDKKTQ